MKTTLALLLCASLGAGTPYDKDPEPHELGWTFVAVAALVLGLLPSILMGLAE